ncbi:MAG: hypothetical protein M1457_14295, partial [bacterium]|nr:hypothetical protein [bacterium]
MPVEDILNALTVPKQWVWIKHSDGTYDIYDKDTYVKTVQASQVIRYPFQLKYIDAEELNKVIAGVLTPVIGASAVDARTNKLIVTDLPDKISLIQEIIKEYDVQQFSRTFEIKNADVEEIGERLGEIKSKAAEVQVDPRTRVIVVKDTFEKIKEMEQLIELLDRELEMVVYNLNNIGEEAKDAQDLVDAFITPLVTTDALVQYNQATGKLFVRDIPAVQKKILEVLKQLDQPKKQVLIEGEILDVAQTYSKDIGINWTIGESLPKALAAGLNIGGVMINDTGTSLYASNFTALKDAVPIASGGSSGLQTYVLTNQVRAQLTAALTDSRTHLLLRPRLLISNKELGTFNVTHDEPVLNTFYTGIENAATTTGFNNTYSSTQNFVSSGLRVEITPQISNRGLVELHIYFENSSPIIVPDIGNGVRGVGKSTSSAETILVIPSGETRVIGGLISNDESNGDTGIPYLSQIPYLGYLFGTKSKSDNKRNLMFFVTP